MKRAALLLVLMAGLGCGSEPAPARACVPGATQTCVCADGRSGAQSCNSAASGFDACVCAGDAGGDARPAEAGADTGPLRCDQALPTEFECALPVKRAEPGTVCTEEQLQALVKDCIADPLTKTPATCSAWRAANAACAVCTGAFSFQDVGSRAVPDRNECYWAILDDTCERTVNCSFECQALVCADCDDGEGTSADGKTSEYLECTDRARIRAVGSRPKGVCWDLASKAAEACLTAADYRACYVDELYTATGTDGKIDFALLRTQIVEFYRVVCRDGGDGSYRFSPIAKGADAGVDAAPDASTDAATDGG